MLTALAYSHSKLASPLICLLLGAQKQQCSCHKLCCCRYDRYLFFGANKQKEMSYVAHLGQVSKTFDKLDILSTKKTHAMRGSGARDSSDSGWVAMQKSWLTAPLCVCFTCVKLLFSVSVLLSLQPHLQFFAAQGVIGTDCHAWQVEQRSHCEELCERHPHQCMFISCKPYKLGPPSAKDDC